MAVAGIFGCAAVGAIFGTAFGGGIGAIVGAIVGAAWVIRGIMFPTDWDRP